MSRNIIVEQTFTWIKVIEQETAQIGGFSSPGRPPKSTGFTAHEIAFGWSEYEPAVEDWQENAASKRFQEKYNTTLVIESGPVFQNRDDAIAWSATDVATQWFENAVVQRLFVNRIIQSSI